MATLYVVGVPAGDPDDITLRALRILGEVSYVVAADVTQAQRLLNHYELATRLISLDNVAAQAGLLETNDMALLADGWRSSPSAPALALIHLALERGHPVVPVPGPSLPITALVVSGLPADSFVYLGELPQQPQSLQTLLSSVAHERRTLVMLETPGHLHHNLAGLFDVLGDRKLVVAAAHDRGTEVLWRGTICEALEYAPPEQHQGPRVLVVGGSRDQAIRWDEGRLRTEVQARLDQGLGAKEVSREMAAESGWPQREVYRLAVEVGHFPRSE